jgi:hypothetical protein
MKWKIYFSKHRQTLWRKMKKLGFKYDGLKGWFDPNGNATGIFWNSEKEHFYTVMEDRKKKSIYNFHQFQYN